MSNSKTAASLKSHVKFTSLEFPLDLKTVSLVRTHPSPTNCYSLYNLGEEPCKSWNFLGLPVSCKFHLQPWPCLFPFLPESVCLHVCVGPHVCTDVYAYVCIYMWKQKDTFRYCSSGMDHLAFFVRQLFSLTWRSPSRPR